jgi:hypothetical protein
LSLPRRVCAGVRSLSLFFLASFYNSLIKLDIEIDVIHKSGWYIRLKEQHVLNLRLQALAELRK